MRERFLNGKNIGMVRHGHTPRNSPTYRTWNTMLDRCLNENAPNFPSYGGRGITVCPQWRDFLVFLADMGERPAGTTLDRKDNDGNYEPTNCRWATAVEQNRNNRNVHYVTYDGLTLSVTEWAERFGLPRTLVFKRLRRGWSVVKALTCPARQYKAMAAHV